MLPQFARQLQGTGWHRHLDRSLFGFLVIGLFKKVVLADNCRRDRHPAL